MNTIKINLPNCKTKIVAHRGYAYCNLENTLEAFKYANTTYCYGVECDIQPSLNGDFFVFHDANIKRLEVNNKFGIIRLKTSNQIKNIKIGEPNNYFNIPSLQDYLGAVTSKVKVIELKGKFSIRLIKKLLNIVKNVNNVIFISFSLSNVKNLKKLNSKLNVQLLSEDFNNEVLNFAKNYKVNLNLSKQIVTNKVVELCHTNNILVNVWTVDTEAALIKFVKMGVDFITTNKFEIIS